jgi:hypothetical protein
MHCLQCGGEMALDERFCGECGAARPRLGAEFENARIQFLALKARCEAGQATEAEYQAALQKLVIQDAGGAYWTIGAESGEWYWHDGKAWRRAEPPAMPAAPPADPKASPSLPPARQAAPPPARPRRYPRACLLTGVFALALLCFAAGLIYTFRQPLLDRFVNLSLQQGWGTVVEEESAAQPLPPPDGWQAVDLSDVGVRLFAPPDGVVKFSPQDAYAAISLPEPRMVIDIMWMPADPGDTLEGAAQDWLLFQRNFTWDEPLIRRCGLGEYAWSQGVSERPWPVWTAVYFLFPHDLVLIMMTSLPEQAQQADFDLLLQISDSARPLP